MFSDVKQFLTSVISPERTTLYLRGLETLKLYLGDSIADYSSEWMRNVKNQELDTALAQLTDFILEQTESILGRYSIKLNGDYLEDTELETSIKLLRGMLEIEHYEDIVYLNAILENSDSNELALAEIISVVTDTVMEDYIELIDGVSDSFIHNLIKLIQTKLEDNQPESIGRALHPVLLKFVKSDYIQYVPERIKKTLAARPYSLSLESILRSFGNSIADDKAGQYTWVFVALISEDFSETIDPNKLYNVWSKHFLEEKDMMDMYRLVGGVFKELLAGEQHEA